MKRGAAVFFLAAGFSFLHHPLQPRQRLIPLARNVLQRPPSFLHAPRLQLKNPLPSPANSPHKAGLLQHAEMFRDCLPRNSRACRQTRNRIPRPAAQPGQQPQPRRVGQRRKYPRTAAHHWLTSFFSESFFTASCRHASRCSSSAVPSRRCSCGTPRHVAWPGSDRSRIQ